MPNIPMWLEDQLYREIYLGHTLSAMYHGRAFIALDNATKGCVSVQSFRYNTSQRRYWSDKGRQAMFQMIGDGTPECDLDPAECEAF